MIKIVNEDSFTIGRSMDCTIPLTEDSISRVHLIVHRRQDQIWIEDKGSSNGTFVNNVRIAQNTLVNVAPKDRIRMGKSDYVVCISLEIEEQGKSDFKDTNSTDATEVLESLKTSKTQQRNSLQALLFPKDKKSEMSEGIKEEVKLQVKTEEKKEVKKEAVKEVKQELKIEENYEAPAYNQQPSQYEAEKILHEAHKKAAQIIYDGEVQAEKRAQVLFVEARERQTQAESFYQKKVQDAHKEADRILSDFEIQGQGLLEQARRFSQEIRDEVETFSRSLREKARKEAEEIIAAAHKEAEVFKHETYERARGKAEAEAAGLIAQANEECKKIFKRAEQEAEVLLDKTRAEMEGDLRDLKEQLEQSKKDLSAALREQEKYGISAALVQEELKGKIAELKKEEKLVLEVISNKSTLAQEEMKNKIADLKKEEQRVLEEMSNKSALAQEEMKKKIAELKKEEQQALADINSKSALAQEEMKNKIADLKKEQHLASKEVEKVKKELGGIRTEESNLEAKIREKTKISEDLEKEISKLNSDSKALERKNKDLQEQLAHFSLDMQAAEDQKKIMERDLVHQKMLLKERLEKENQQIIKESERRLEDSQLEMSKRLQKLEQEMLDEILGRKETLVKDIIVIIETRIAKVLEPAKWDQISIQIFEGISETIEGKAVTFSENSKAPKESASLQRKKKKENLRWMYGGVAAGVATSILGLQTYIRVVNDKNPMRTIAAEASRKRLEDLDRRKFNPPQVRAIKETYVDAVIYTSGFVAAYQDPAFQQNLYKAASAYLLKTWRVDEDKSIQVLSMSSALIKELSGKRQSIHPDYVKDAIAKMRALENESLERMKALLGSEVRLESYRRFERKFFETEILNK